MVSPIPTAMLLAVLAGGTSAQAGHGGQAAMPAVDPAMCDALASMPSAPMTVETCRKMLLVAQDDPSAHRPGDESMSCGDIYAELQSVSAGIRISDEQAARNLKTIDDMKTLNQRHGSRAAAALAPNAAAMHAIGTVAPFVPSAVTAPAIAAQQAQIQAKGRIAGAAYSAEARKLTGESADATALIMGDPRTRRLSQLTLQKNCTDPSR